MAGNLSGPKIKKPNRRMRKSSVPPIPNTGRPFHSCKQPCHITTRTRGASAQGGAKTPPYLTHAAHKFGSLFAHLYGVCPNMTHKKTAARLNRTAAHHANIDALIFFALLGGGAVRHASRSLNSKRSTNLRAASARSSARQNGNPTPLLLRFRQYECELPARRARRKSCRRPPRQYGRYCK